MTALSGARLSVVRSRSVHHSKKFLDTFPESCRGGQGLAMAAVDFPKEFGFIRQGEISLSVMETN